MRVDLEGQLVIRQLEVVLDAEEDRRQEALQPSDQGVVDGRPDI